MQIMLSRLRGFPARWNLVFALCAAVFIVTFFEQDIAGRTRYINHKDVRPADLESINVAGFVAAQDESHQNCENGLVNGQLQVSLSRHLESDLAAIAGSISHAMINYTNYQDLSFPEQVERTWAAIAGSSVWLTQLEAYFSVKRVFYYNRSDKYHPIISFIYAQVYDENWQHLENFTISWQGEEITYPRVLDIAAPFMDGGRYYGPEDPRIILEDIEDAEPAVIFNMMADVETKNRHMYIHRPFSNFTTILQIDNQAPHRVEKNWSPFFVPRNNRRGNKIWPSKYIHFVYDWHPLVILRCHMLNGYCSIVHRDTLSPSVLDAEARQDKNTKNALHGGSNLEPLLSATPGQVTFVGFPRVKLMSIGCHRGAVYRPVLSLLKVNRAHFDLAYVSEGLDLGHAVLSLSQYDDVCDSGRIMLINSIARVDAGGDSLTLSYTVDDSTIQIGTLRGVSNLTDDLQSRFNPSVQLVTESKDEVEPDTLTCALERTAAKIAIRANVVDALGN